MLDILQKYIVKYKLIHVGYWIYAFTTLFHVLEQNATYEGSTVRNFCYTLVMIICRMGCVYFTTEKLLPDYLYKRRYFKFTLYLFISIVTTSAVSALAREWVARVWGIHMPPFLISTITAAADAVFTTSVFVGFTLLADHYQTREKNKLLEKERLETELNFLKAQINPHFMFNALNNIYIMIDLDKEVAGRTLLKFSSLLRYQLYDCNINDTEIEKEIGFLKDFVGLEMMRKGKKLQLELSIPENIRNFKIAPFIIITFVENAFKHVSRNGRNEYFVSIGLSLEGQSFRLRVENSWNPSTRAEASGIGLQNVRRRLELLYPGRYHLRTDDTEGIYRIHLEIKNIYELHHH